MPPNWHLADYFCSMLLGEKQHFLNQYSSIRDRGEFHYFPFVLGATKQVQGIVLFGILVFY